MQPYRIEQLHGYDALYPKRIIEYMEEAYPEAWKQAERLCSLEYYLFPHKADDRSGIPAAMEFVATADGIDIFHNSAALPRAFLAPVLETLQDSTAVFHRMRDPAFNPAQVLLQMPKLRLSPRQQGLNLRAMLKLRRGRAHAFLSRLTRPLGVSWCLPMRSTPDGTPM